MTMLKINTSTTPTSLKEMSTAEYAYAVETILVDFASTDTGVGTISINPAVTTGLTSIGTFTDTYRNFAVGTHPAANTITTANTYTAYQDLQAASESLTRPIEYSSGLKEQNDTALNADLITVVLANLVANGVGSYALNPTAPVGGTWTSKYTIVDTINPTTTANTYLWRKTASGASPTVVRPMKINTVTSPVSLKEMSDAEIKTLTNRMRNQIVSTGVGKYAFQQSAPVGGTWVTQGAAFSDTRNTLTDQNYSGNYSGTYSRGFTGSYILYYGGFINRTSSGTYTGSFTGSYTGSYTGATINVTTESVSTVALWVRTA